MVRDLSEPWRTAACGSRRSDPSGSTTDLRFIAWRSQGLPLFKDVRERAVTRK